MSSQGSSLDNNHALCYLQISQTNIQINDIQQTVILKSFLHTLLCNRHACTHTVTESIKISNLKLNSESRFQYHLQTPTSVQAIIVIRCQRKIKITKFSSSTECLFKSALESSKNMSPKTPRRASSQMIHFHHTYWISLQSSPLHYLLNFFAVISSTLPTPANIWAASYPLQQNNCTWSSYLITLQPWVMVKAIYTCIKI